MVSTKKLTKKENLGQKIKSIESVFFLFIYFFFLFFFFVIAATEEQVFLEWKKGIGKIFYLKHNLFMYVHVHYYL